MSEFDIAYLFDDGVAGRIRPGPGRADHIAGALDVDLALPLVVARPYRCVGGQMEDRENAFRYCAAERVRLKDIALDQIVRQARNQSEVRRAPIQRRDLPALCHQLLDQIEAQEPRASGHECAGHCHASRLCGTRLETGRANDATRAPRKFEQARHRRRPGKQDRAAATQTGQRALRLCRGDGTWRHSRMTTQ